MGRDRTATKGMITVECVLLPAVINRCCLFGSCRGRGLDLVTIRTVCCCRLRPRTALSIVL